MSDISSATQIDGVDILLYGVSGNKRMARVLRATADCIESAEDIRLVWIKKYLAWIDGAPCEVDVPGAALCAEGHIKAAVFGDANYVDEWRALAALVLSAEDAFGSASAVRAEIGLGRALPWAEALLSRGAVRADCIDARGSDSDVRFAASVARETYYWPLARAVNALNDAQWMTADLICGWFRKAAERLDP